MGVTQDKLDSLVIGEDYECEFVEERRWGPNNKVRIRVTVLETGLPMVGQVGNYGVKVKPNKITHPAYAETFEGVQVVHVRKIGQKWDDAFALAEESVRERFETGQEKMRKEIEKAGNQWNAWRWATVDFTPRMDDITSALGLDVRPGAHLGAGVALHDKNKIRSWYDYGSELIGHTVEVWESEDKFKCTKRPIEKVKIVGVIHVVSTIKTKDDNTMLDRHRVLVDDENNMRPDLHDKFLVIRETEDMDRALDGRGYGEFRETKDQGVINI